MSAAWPEVPLGELLARSKEQIALNPDSAYSEVTVRINGKGVVERRKVNGIDIAAARRYKARAGQFIISRIDARHGASGLIPPELDGAIVTNDFPLFDVAEHRLDPAYLSWMSKTASFVELCKQASEGTTNRVRLSEDRFNALQIHLPPLDEQRRIVTRIEELAAKLEQARGLRSQLGKELNGLWRSSVSHCLTTATLPSCEIHLPEVGVASRRNVTIPTKINDVAASWEVPKGWLRISVGELLLRGALLDVKDGNHGSNHPKSAEFSDNGTPFLMASDIANGQVLWSDAALLPVEAQSRLRIGFSQAGDVLFTHKASIGKTALSDRPSILSPQVTYYRCASDHISPSWLERFLGSDLFLAQLSDIQQQSTRDFVSISKQYHQFLLLPPIDQQHSMAAELDALQAKVDAVKALQTETATELDAMLPAILDRAFKGEL